MRAVLWIRIPSDPSDLRLDWEPDPKKTESGSKPLVGSRSGSEQKIARIGNTSTHMILYFLCINFYRGLSVWLFIFSGFLSKKKVWNALWNMTYEMWFFWRRRECAVGWSSFAVPDPLESNWLSYGSGTGSESESRSEPLVGSGSEQKSCSDPQHIQTQDSQFFMHNFDRRLSVWLFIFAEFF